MNYPRTNYEMTEADLEKILDACKSVPMIMLQCGPTRGPQERANDAWKELGDRMGFDHMTVQPRLGMGNRFFTAVPNETEDQKRERLTKEAENKKQLEIALLKAEIEQRQERLKSLEG